MSHKGLASTLRYDGQLNIVVKLGGDVLGHFLNSHFLQAGFCPQSAHGVTNTAFSTRLTIFSQSPLQLVTALFLRNIFFLLDPGSPHSCLMTTISQSSLASLPLYFQILVFPGVPNLVLFSSLFCPLLGEFIFQLQALMITP